MVRKSLQPGTVCILLAGRYRGRRVVNLGPLEGNNGPLLVSGPYKLNGVPLRRVDPAYVIATSTKVDVSKVDRSKVTKGLFNKPRKAQRKRNEKQFLKIKASANADAKKKSLEERKALQKKVDEALIKSVAATPNLAKYLATPFSLQRNEAPHKLQF
eukprot:PhF_6_TR18545/c1_g1_i2/m.27083/K02934/RP-L6e, RPL6; large subunit ribosomal protein L6e